MRAYESSISRLLLRWAQGEADMNYGRSAAGTILLIEDDLDFSGEFGGFLAAHGFATASAVSVGDAMDLLNEREISLIVLDQFLGGRDSLGDLAIIRQRFEGPLIILTNNADESDRIIGLELGADDFASKLLKPREILARVKAVIRRYRGPQATVERHSFRLPSVSKQPWTINVARRTLVSADGTLVRLTTATFNALLALTETPEEVVTRSHLDNVCLRRGSFNADDRAVDNLISRLRREIGKYLPDVEIIRSIRGRGYQFVGFDFIRVGERSATANIEADRQLN